MRPYDVVAIVLLVSAAGAFAFGSWALSTADDFRAFYMLALGGSATWAAVQIARSGVRQ